jgi:hypothetical protein
MPGYEIFIAAALFLGFFVGPHWLPLFMEDCDRGLADKAEGCASAGA